MGWHDKYALAEQFYLHYGHCCIPLKFKTFDGINYDENGIKLGSWLEKQGCAYRDTLAGKPTARIMNEERIKLLEAIEAPFSKRAYNWFQTFEIAKRFYDYHGHSIFPKHFKTLNGIDFDEKGPNLYTWSIIQGKKIRHSIDKLTEEQIEALKSIQFKFPNSNASRTWEYNYSLAQSFYQENFHLNVPYEYMTPNEEKLGSWIDTQRNHQKELNSYQKEKLDNLSMIWSLHDNNHEINTLFELYGIKKFLNKNQLKQLKNYPAKEVEVKLSYLVKNGLPVIKDEKINEIFFMSNLNVEAKYGLRIKELVTKQYINKEK